MKTASKLTYALVLGILALSGQAWGLDPVDHKPIPDLVAALKSSGQVRIAQGVEDVIAKDAKTGELFSARAILILTTNKQTGEWTISVVHDKIVASTVLIGTNLQRISTNEIPNLPTFDRQKAGEIMPRFHGWGPAYYPDEIARYAKLGFQRMWTGQFALTTEPLFKEAMTPVFVDVIVRPNDAGFAVLVVDQYGACAKVATGSLFSERS